MPNAIASAIKFNEIKHMKTFQLESLQRWVTACLGQVKDDLNALGGNQFDVYTGSLNTQEVISQVAGILNALEITSRPELRGWLDKRQYREVYLSDGSRWVIREGEEPDKFVHLHPGRNQDFVKRLKSSHLKTALMVLYLNIDPKVLDGDEATVVINRIRKEKLGLSPVKSAADSRRIREALEFLYTR